LVGIRRPISDYFYLSFAILFFVPQLIQAAFPDMSTYLLGIMILSMIYMTTCLSLAVIFGFVGWVNLAQQAFFGIGAYISAILVKNLGLPFLAGFIAAGVFVAVVSYLIGIPSLRLNPFAFSIVTLSFLIIVQLVALNWVAVTNGPTGIGLIPNPVIDIFGVHLDFSSNASMYYLSLVVALATFVFINFLTSSRVGRALVSIREDESLAKAVGIDVFKYKMIAFVTCGFFAGLAGSLYAHYVTVVMPIDIFNVYFLIYQFIIVVVGGATSLGGIAAASVVFTFAPEVLRMAKELRETVYGVLLVIMILFMPEGIGGKVKEIRSRRVKIASS
jgi:branched-chain amino acid transport system permease protein